MQAERAPKKLSRAIAVAAIILAGILVIMIGSQPANKDYIEYWSTGKLLVHQANPYSANDIFTLEKSQGYTSPRPLVAPNPPWSIFLVWPLGFFNARIGLLLWLCAAVGCILLSAHLLDIPAKDRALIFVFAPAFAAISSGQCSPFFLLGFCIFLRFHNSRPFLAGVSLLLMAMKPHLFLLFWAVLLAESIYRRRFRILMGGTAGLIIGTAFSMCLDPHIWRQYLAMWHQYPPAVGFIPTASMIFRMLISVNRFWLLFVPSGVGILWSIWYFARHRQTWNWKTHGMLLILLTILLSPYAWFSDELVLLPAIAFALTLKPPRRYTTSILLGINVIALVLLTIADAQLSSPAYIWTPVAWLAWFLYATHQPKPRDYDTLMSLANQEAH